MEALYVIGEPGVGKSTLVEHLTAGLPFEETQFPFPYRYYDCGVMELGVRRPDFPGTDAYPLNIQPAVEKYVEAVQPAMLLAEGDRLANGKFFAHLMALGYRLQIAYLVSEAAAENRRMHRGSKQDPTWLKGRQTKVLKLSQEYGAWTQHLRADYPPATLVKALSSPVATRLREAQR